MSPKSKMLCMYGQGHCPAPVFGVKNRVGVMVSYLCAEHRKSTWAATAHPGLTVVPLHEGGKEDEMGPTTPGGGGVIDPDRPQEDSQPVVTGAGDSADHHMGGGGENVPRGTSPARPEGPASDALPAVAGPKQPPAPLVGASPDIFAGAGALTISDEQCKVLLRPWEEDMYQIRDDGEVYVPWQRYAERLTAALGPFAWSLVPLEKPTLQGADIYVRYALIVEGHFIAEATESHPWRAGSYEMTYDDAVESARSECLRRLCKGRVGNLSAWDASFRRSWKATYATRVWRVKRQRWAWRRTDGEPFADEGKPGYSAESEYRQGRRLEDDNQQHIDSIQGRKPGEEG